MKNEHTTLTGRTIDLATLTTEQRAVFDQLLQLYKTGPARKDFCNEQRRVVKSTLPKLSADDRLQHPLARAAEDLEMRLGIAQGLIAPPDYRDYISEAIDEQYGSRYRFCKDNGISESLLSQVFAGKKNLSIEKLEEVAALLGLSLVLMPTHDLEALHCPS